MGGEQLKKLSIIDSAFLMMREQETPMHTGSFNLFTLPEEPTSRSSCTAWRKDCALQMNCSRPSAKIKGGPRGMLGPLYWEKDTSLDLDYHIRHSALPKPGRFRESFALVSGYTVPCWTATGHYGKCT